MQCPTCKIGTMFNVTSRLAHSFGITTLECDNCHTRENIKHKPMVPCWEIKENLAYAIGTPVNTIQDFIYGYCPRCGAAFVSTKWGGVECSNPHCSY